MTDAESESPVVWCGRRHLSPWQTQALAPLRLTHHLLQLIAKLHAEIAGIVPGRSAVVGCRSYTATLRTLGAATKGWRSNTKAVVVRDDAVLFTAQSNREAAECLAAFPGTR